MSTLEDGDKLAASVQKPDHPRVTLEYLNSLIVSGEYFNPSFAPHVTIAALHCRNGFVLTGMSAPADPANYDAEVGKKFAYDDALRKLWAHEGYLLRERLNDQVSQVTPE